MKQTEQECTKFMQEKLISHLWNIADDCGGTDCVFLLSSRHLGEGMVQDITVLNGNASSHQTVFGYKPVDLAIEISGNGDDYTMSLIPFLKTSCRTSRLNRRISAFRLSKRTSHAPLTRNLCLNSAH